MTDGRAPDYRAIARQVRRGRDAAAALSHGCPRLVDALRSDGSRPGLLALWGRSVNWDEHAQGEIVDAALLDVLHGWAGVAAHSDSVHSGVTHSYGYLFSLLQTPYGWKGSRWLAGTAERAAGLPARSWHPAPTAGTLLANLTYFLARVAFRGRPRELAAVRRHRAAVAPQIVAHDYRSLAWDRVVERIPLRKGLVELRTDLLPPTSRSGGERLLVYSIMDDRQPLGSLITCFSVSGETAAELVHPDRCGPRVPCRLRYNAFVAELVGRTLRGQRELQKVGGRGSGPRS